MKTIASELHTAEQALMRHPCSIRLRLKVQRLRTELQAQKEAQARKLRGQIRRSLCSVGVQDLNVIARYLEETRAL